MFLCLLHNLMVLFEAGLAETGISNVAEEKRREKVLTEHTERVEKTGRKMPLIIAGFQRLTQRTVKFIRWLRSFFWHNRPLDELRLILKKRYATLGPFTGHRSFSAFFRGGSLITLRNWLSTTSWLAVTARWPGRTVGAGRAEWLVQWAARAPIR